VSFPPGYEPGSIIVQFSARRLYFVLPHQQAISYPIAALMGEARWCLGFLLFRFVYLECSVSVGLV
jgi:hypothetical protein